MYQSPSGSQLTDPQEALLQTPTDSLDGLLFPDVQPEDQTFTENEDLYAESTFEKVLAESFMTSPAVQSRSFDPWSPFNIADMPSDANLTSDLNEAEISQRTRESPGVNTSKTIWPENVTEAKPMPHPLPPKPKDVSTQEQGGHGKSASPALSSRPLNLDFLRVPIIPLNPAFLAAKARQILEVDTYDFDSFSSRPCSQSSLDLGGFEPSNLDSQEDTTHNLSPSRIKQEDGISYLFPSTNPSGPGHSLAPLVQKTPGPLFKTEPSLMFEAFNTSGGRPASSSQFPSFVYPGASLPSTSSASQARLQAFSQNGHQHVMNYQSTGQQDLTHFYAPYASYQRSDTKSEHSSQYNYEVIPQKMCLICGDEASGCHYGVLTCGSCKVFFKRAMEGQQNYLCAGRNDCIIDKIRRKNCPACRLRKCCQAGMVLGGRKFKKFNKLKTVHGMQASAYTQPLVISVENQQAIVPGISTNSTQELQFFPQLLNILQTIEPEVVLAGYDNTQLETPSCLLTNLNQLCEKQLLCVVKWSKSLPGFRNLHIEDQLTLLQYSWMSLMVFAMGWRSYQHVSGLMLYFAPDLIFNEQRMKQSSIYSLCLAMWAIPEEFAKLQITEEEFLCMKALILLNTIPLEGLRSQSLFDEMRGNYIRELVKVIGLRQNGVVASSQRFYQLTKLMDSMHDLVKQLHLFCLNTFLQSRSMSVEFPEMMSEVITAQLPRILAGMNVLLFIKCADIMNKCLLCHYLDTLSCR